MARRPGEDLRGENDPEVGGERLRKRDRNVNRMERSIRRQLVVHAGVRGASADTPLILTYMSIIKDIERIGDYAKNIWDMAAEGVDVSASSNRKGYELQAKRTCQLIDDTARIFKDRDIEAATQLLPTVDGWLDEHDLVVSELLNSDLPSREGVPLALFHRYVKRIHAHLMNVLTALVMPFDRLDYWDEAALDRE
ncbi:MAG: PhoU domain-containing protein [Acidimicrobiia bacterium]